MRKQQGPSPYYARQSNVARRPVEMLYTTRSDGAVAAAIVGLIVAGFIIGMVTSAVILGAL